jgi:hypothetical protein
VFSPALLLPLHFLLVVTLDLVFHLFLALSLVGRLFLLPGLLLTLSEEGVMGSLDQVLGNGLELAFKPVVCERHIDCLLSSWWLRFGEA